MELGHDELADVGAKWLRSKGYPIAFSNMRSANHGEQPDVLGFSMYGETFLLEAKVSRSDFLSDRKKPWRAEGKGIGMKRGYIVLEGIAKPEEIPYGWWLLEVYGKTKPRVRVVKGKAKEKSYTPWDIERGREGDKRFLKDLLVARNGDWDEINHVFYKDNHDLRPELMWTLKVLKRMKDCGINIEKYAQHVEAEQQPES